jgi:hypothetical protein
MANNTELINNNQSSSPRRSQSPAIANNTDLININQSLSSPRRSQSPPESREPTFANILN